MGCWHGYLSGARCRLAYAQLMPLPLTVSCFSSIQIGFTFLILPYPGSPGKRAVKRVCVCVLPITQATLSLTENMYAGQVQYEICRVLLYTSS